MKTTQKELRTLAIKERAERLRLQRIEEAAKAWLADNLRCGYQGLLRNILAGRGPKDGE